MSVAQDLILARAQRLRANALQPIEPVLPPKRCSRRQLSDKRGRSSGADGLPATLNQVTGFAHKIVPELTVAPIEELKRFLDRIPKLL